MKTIRTKLIAYFLVFVLLFNCAATAIYLSSSQLLNAYDSGIDRFFILNSISQTITELIGKVNRFVVERDAGYVKDFQQLRMELENRKDLLDKEMSGLDPYQLKKYENMIGTFIEESELTIGFALKDDIDLYNFHLQEAQNTSNYIKETTLDLIDLELNEYQAFYRQLNERNENFRKFIVFLFLTSTLLAVFFALWFSKELNQPIQALTKMAREVSAGNLEGEALKIRTNDELKILGEAFNQMRGNIRDLIEEIRKKSEQEQLLKDLELKHLQNQIQPHFLFNTLNTISRMAFLEEAEQTMKLIESVSSLLRYSLGDLKKSVTLAEEIKVVEDYFHIQRTRFFDRISFSAHIDQNCLDTEIPRLILQPIIENAFIHGVEGKEEGGEIRLSVRQLGDVVIVEVKDNGAGMAEEKIRKYLSMDAGRPSDAHTGHTTGLGLENVIRRLQLFYGKKEVINISSKLGEGTTVQLFLPKKQRTANREKG